MSDAQRAPQTRLSVLLARQSRVAVVFRRGPSKQVLLVRWERDRDRFYLGQWFKGRVYECRCDLSPDGEQLVYFAANFKAPSRSWTAVSRPPYFTALALWPKGDCWGGGGHFVAAAHLQLNHRSKERTLQRGFMLPRGMHVEAFGEHSGWGEDSPIEDERLLRDGWVLTNPGKQQENADSAPVWISYEPSLTWSRPNPKRAELVLHAALVGIKQREGPWRVLQHRVSHGDQILVDLGQSDWADWDRNGDLLYACDGKLFRCKLVRGQLREPRQLIDLSPLRFRELAPSVEAQSWDRPLNLAPLIWASSSRPDA